jgi:hypothetical protein
MHVADQWKTALLDWASERSGGLKQHQFNTVCGALPTDMEGLNVASTSKKQKTESTNHTKYSKKIFCIKDCSRNNLNATLIHVCNTPSESLPINASHTQQITYQIKQFM